MMTMDQAGVGMAILPCVLLAAWTTGQSSPTAAAHRAMATAPAVERPASFRQLAEAARTTSSPTPLPWHFSLPYAALA